MKDMDFSLGDKVRYLGYGWSLVPYNSIGTIVELNGLSGTPVAVDFGDGQKKWPMLINIEKVRPEMDGSADEEL